MYLALLDPLDCHEPGRRAVFAWGSPELEIWAQRRMLFANILRHANVRTTQDSYIKTADPDVVAAMQRLEAATAQTRSKIAVLERAM